MSPALTTFLICVVLAAAILIINGYNKKKKSMELVVHKYGKSDIFIRRFEIEHFESLTREEKRRLVNKFQSKVKQGVYKKVIKDSKCIGYVRNI